MVSGPSACSSSFGAIRWFWPRPTQEIDLVAVAVLAELVDDRTEPAAADKAAEKPAQAALQHTAETAAGAGPAALTHPSAPRIERAREIAEGAASTATTAHRLAASDPATAVARGRPLGGSTCNAGTLSRREASSAL